ncbi:DUF305 domain-containing protein [Agromyces lapidis]|uniref:DUF305 domain-containing protein n=1 Tax=Agromyces lapidis TaxID=279574 RepID=A0ABV5SUF5_9MICO|nr:DUF305 domain-containing protein [Agromyces lapidis]
MLTARTTLTAATALVAALTLAGCTATQQNETENAPAASASPTAEAVFNDADVTFAQMMIPHHEQAIEMSDSLLEKDGVDEQVRELAEQIKDAQQPEIDQMTDWLDEWGADESMGPAGHDMGAMGDGMMSGEDMGRLDDATGAEASALFLEQMIMHHEGAIDMAEVEVENGENPDAVALAEQIIEDQTNEIAEMQDLLAAL